MDFTDETIPMPRIGDQAPVFDAVTTQGKIHFPLDFNGKWIILFSHPSDFTPVCTSEFVTFGAKIEYKGKKNVEVQFPLIADVTMEVAHLYGMIQPRESSTNAVRAVFYIDPQGIIRAIIYYPLALGRNFDELKRVLIGLQTIDKYGVALPADWCPGDEVIAPTPGSFNAANERMDKPASGTRCYDWFFCLKKLPEK